MDKIKTNTSISFVIPAYNAEQTLAESVDSIFNGNFLEHDEVIIVDDASTDKTSELILTLVKKYTPYIKSIQNKKNMGCPASRNVGIAEARGELIFNLDSDNVLAPGMITKLKDALIKTNSDVCMFGECHYFTHSTAEVTHKWICKTGNFTLADFLSGIINQGPGGNYLYKRSLWEKVGHFWEIGKGLHEAWANTLKFLINDAHCFVVPNTYYYHRWSHESLFVRESKKKNLETEITNKFIEPLTPLLTKVTQAYIKSTPHWYSKLESTPLYLANGQIGIDGKVVHHSLIASLRHRLGKSFRKYLKHNKQV